MTSKERVLNTLRGENTDRVPLNVFAGWNPGIRKRVEEQYGHVDDFCEQHHIDIVTGVMPRFAFGSAKRHAEICDLDTYLSLDPVDPNESDFLDRPCDEEDLFLTPNEALKYKQNDKAIFIHAWGVFELSQFLFEKDGNPGFEDALINMIAEKEKTAELYLKLAEWSAACVERAIQAGADVIQLSDDWGQQNALFFNPKFWWEMIYPAIKIIIDTAHKHDVPLILHSDGDITQVLDGLKKLSINGLHPVQESAGMSFERTRNELGSDVCIMGGLDSVTALSAMPPTEIQSEVKRVFDHLKHSGPFIFCGSHMFQDTDSLQVIEAAYKTAYQLAFY